VITLVAEMFGYFVAVEFDRAAAAQIGGAHADGCFKGNELTGFSSHRPTIRRYMLIVKSIGLGAVNRQWTAHTEDHIRVRPRWGLKLECRIHWSRSHLRYDDINSDDQTPPNAVGFTDCEAYDPWLDRPQASIDAVLANRKHI
jgi:hypothetical protein